MKQELVTLSRDVVEQVLDAFENGGLWKLHKTMEELSIAIKQPQGEQEPEAWALSHSKGLEFSSKYPMQKSKQAAEQMARQHMGAVTVSPLYTHQHPKLAHLTDEQIVPMFSKRQKQQTEGEKDAWYFYAWGVHDGESAHNIK